MQKIEDKYTIETEKVDNGKGYWNSIDVTIYQTDEDGSKKEIGKYNRNYSAMYDTFVPFRQRSKDGTIKEYALISDRYVRTAVIELPSCKMIAAEEPHANGFCPTGFKVPFSDEPGDGLDGMFGFVSGCIWGDDCSWKVEYLDLSRIDEGIIQRDARFGYVELPREVSLKDGGVSDDMYFVGEIDFTDSNNKLREQGKEVKIPDVKQYNDDIIEIAVPMRFNCSNGRLRNAYSVIEILKNNGYQIIEPDKKK